MSAPRGNDDPGLDAARVLRARERLAGPLRALVESLDRAGHDGVASFFREAELALDAAVTPEDLQAVFLQRLALSGPVALQGGVGPMEIGMLDDLLCLAQEISMAFIEASGTLH